jgi:hypothetical protein
MNKKVIKSMIGIFLVGVGLFGFIMSKNLSLLCFFYLLSILIGIFMIISLGEKK